VANFVGRSNIVEAEVDSHQADGRIVLSAAGSTLIARSATAEAVGAKVAVSLRPEKLSVALEGGEGPNRVRGTISDYTYHGNSTQLV
ncbi:TOBE domain-containing protein, partial [Acinetobacter baumannii]